MNDLGWAAVYRREPSPLATAHHTLTVQPVPQPARQADRPVQRATYPGKQELRVLMMSN